MCFNPMGIEITRLICARCGGEVLLSNRTDNGPKSPLTLQGNHIIFDCPFCDMVYRLVTAPEKDD